MFLRCLLFVLYRYVAFMCFFVLVVRRLCVSFVCGVCVWAFVFIVLVAVQAPCSKVVSWLFALSILAQIPIGVFWQVLFSPYGVHLKCPFGSSLNLLLST